MDFAALVAQAAAANPMPMTNVPAPTEGLVVHVDGDYCAYYCAGNDDTNPGQARRNLLGRLESVQRASGATSVLVHLTDRASTKGERFLAATVKPYQGQRNSGRKPRNWEVLREYMETYDGDKFVVKNWRTREADDGMAYVAHAAAKSNKLAVIATADKDMRMLPGRHVVWKTMQILDVPFGAFEVIGPESKVYGHKWFWLQMVQGDTADNIPGIPLKGEAFANALLRDIDNNFDAQVAVIGAYEQKYKDEWADRFVEQACLLWLRTDRHAGLLDFTSIMETSPRVDEACERLCDRVATLRAEADELCGG